MSSSVQLESKIIIDDKQVIYTKWNTTLKDALNLTKPQKYFNKYGQIVPLCIPIKGTIHLSTTKLEARS